MSMMLGVGVAAVVGVFYMVRKGWRVLHEAVGITPGTLVYQNPNAPLLCSAITWQALTLNDKHLSSLTQSQLKQLKRIDEKLSIVQQVELENPSQDKEAPVNEAQFVLYKLLYTRLPEILTSHHRMVGMYRSQSEKNQKDALHHHDDSKTSEANELLQSALDNIETRLDDLLDSFKHQGLQELRMMNTYLNNQH